MFVKLTYKGTKTKQMSNRKNLFSKNEFRSKQSASMHLNGNGD